MFEQREEVRLRLRVWGSSRDGEGRRVPNWTWLPVACAFAAEQERFLSLWQHLRRELGRGRPDSLKREESMR